MVLSETQPMVLEDSEFLIRNEDIHLAVRSLKAIPHPLRLKILCGVARKECTVQEIVAWAGISQSNASQHLPILREKGIFATRKDVNRVYYRVSNDRTFRLIEIMREVFCHPRA